MLKTVAILSTLTASLAAAKEGEIFLNAATKYVDDKAGLIQLYTQHFRDHKSGKVSELDGILEDMNVYCEDNEDSKGPKHVLTILADDMGLYDIGYNDPTFITPTLDIMASRGVKFNNFYVQSTCSPTRSSLLTGRDVQNTGMQDGAIVPGESRFLPLNFQLAGNYFHDAGYSTNFIGKWHLGQRYLNETPNARGYDYFFGILGGTIDSYNKHIGLLCGSAENNYTAVFGDNCQFLNGYDFQENGVIYSDNTTYASDILTNKAVARIKAHDKSKGFLMHYHHNAPHAPLKAPQQLIDNCAGCSAAAPDSIRPYFRQLICGMVTSVDIDILRVLFALGINGMLPNTLVEFSSDNGGYTLAGSLNGPYRGQKGATLEGGIRAPCFVWGNGLHIGHFLNPVRDDLVSVSDILPTLLGYAGIKTGSFLSSPFDGYDLWPSLTKGLPFVRQHVPINSATEALGYFGGYIQKIGSVTWKYVINPSVLEFVATSSLGSVYVPEGEGLYNLSEDPYETTNLATDTSIASTVALNLLRLRLWAMRQLGAPSLLNVFPPVIDLPPNNGGCWIAMDSPYWDTAVCPTAPVVTTSDETLKSAMTEAYTDKEGVFHLGASDMTNQYISSNLNL